jgi:hypothetical protein
VPLISKPCSFETGAIGFGLASGASPYRNVHTALRDCVREIVAANCSELIFLSFNEFVSTYD